MAPEDWLRAETQGDIVALVHSHPGGQPYLSDVDRRLQVKATCRGGWYAPARYINSAVCHT
ncbi:Tail fiber component K [Salmonella enterica subsp. enterica]|nr:Tail fiber component K [Salmonella enterica subsp. enterica]